MVAHDNRKNNRKSKFFLQISDNQQSMVPDPSRGLPHNTNSAGSLILEAVKVYGKQMKNNGRDDELRKVVSSGN
jgi:hypothetical protein